MTPTQLRGTMGKFPEAGTCQAPQDDVPGTLCGEPSSTTRVVEGVEWALCSACAEEIDAERIVDSMRERGATLGELAVTIAEVDSEPDSARRAMVRANILQVWAEGVTVVEDVASLWGLVRAAVGVAQ